MRNLVFIPLLTILLIFTNCERKNPAENISENVNVNTADLETETPKTLTKTLYTTVDLLRLRNLPASKSQILQKLAEGDSLKFLGEETMDQITVELRGEKVTAPWVKVETFEGVQGWVFGGGVTDNPPLRDRLPLSYDLCFVGDKEQKTFDAKCFDRTAFKELNSAKKFIINKGNELVFKLLSGDLKSMKDENGVDYTYCYYAAKAGFFVLKKDSLATSRFILLNDKSGRTYEINGFPKVSPTGQYFLATPLEQTGEDLKLSIWKQGENGLGKAWEQPFNLGTLGGMAWYKNKLAAVLLNPQDQTKEPIEVQIELSEPIQHRIMN